jgi:FtsP/CotA-like multicopper oxidase with cupredoxin domain
LIVIFSCTKHFVFGIEPNNSDSSPVQTVRYDLYVADTVVNYTGKRIKAIAINGRIPAPTLTFTEGDSAEIYVHNLLNEETSFHWHGVFLPNEYDGVPYLTQQPIKPHETFVYKFLVKQNGTYWYHSHTRLQEQSGMYGILIFKKRNEPVIPVIPVIISDWTNYNPQQINRWLHNASDWFAVKKASTQSYLEAIKQHHFDDKLVNEWKRINAMDVSDVRYDAFLSNGNTELHFPSYKAGDKIKLRLVNGGASTYFWLTYSGGKITVVANDGNDVTPVTVDRLLIAPAETYDLVLEVPENMSYEFVSTAEDRTGSTSIWLGDGMKMPAVKLPKLKYFAGMKMMNAMMDMNGNMKEIPGMKMSNQKMDMNEVMYPEISGYDKVRIDSAHQDTNGNTEGIKLVTLNYSMLKATESTTLVNRPVREFKFNLTGNMNRYVWTINDKSVSETDKIYISKGENIRIILYNNSMMRHPMHLHGHDFRVLNGQGEFAPLKNVLDVMPMETDTIEFAATESGDWFFHCHILYHMMSGMGNVFSYTNSPANPFLTDSTSAMRKFKSDVQMLHFMAKVGVESNGSDGEAMLSQTRWNISTLWHIGTKPEHGYESETMIGRYLGRMQWWYPYVGFDYHYRKMHHSDQVSEEKNWFNQTSYKNDRQAITVGVVYTLPLLIYGDIRVNSKGELRFQLSREDIPLAPRLRLNWMVNTDKEYMVGMRYIISKYISLSTHYDSDMGYGIGFTFTY